MTEGGLRWVSSRRGGAAGASCALKARLTRLEIMSAQDARGPEDYDAPMSGAPPAEELAARRQGMAAARWNAGRDSRRWL